MIKVSCAIIIKGNKVLAVQRGERTDHPFQWEFPGGKIRKDETGTESIIREIKEELSVKIEVFKKLREIEHDYGNKQIRLIPYFCKIAEGNITLTEHIDYKWLVVEDLNKLNWSEADMVLITKNEGFLKKLNDGKY